MWQNEHFGDGVVRQLAPRIAKLSKLDLDTCALADRADVLDDAHRLVMASMGRAFEKPEAAIKLVDAIRDHLDAAVAAAQALPEELHLRHVIPVDRNVEEVIAAATKELHHKLRFADNVLRVEAERFPTRTNPPN